MAFSISKFSTHLNQYGTVKNNRHEVIISPPEDFCIKTSEPFRLITLRAEKAELPSINLVTQKVNRYGIGLSQMFPTNVQFQETISLTFLETANSLIHKFFHDWVNHIFNYSGYVNGIYLAEYKNRYASIMEIKVYLDEGPNYISNKIILTDVFPTQISEVPLSWGDNNTHMRITVKFAFTTIIMDRLNSADENCFPSTEELPMVNPNEESPMVKPNGESHITTTPKSFNEFGNSAPSNQRPIILP